MKYLFLLLTSLFCIQEVRPQQTEIQFFAEYFEELQMLSGARGKERRVSLEEMVATYFVDTAYIDRGRDFDLEGKLSIADYLNLVADQRKKRNYDQQLLYRGTPVYQDGVAERSVILEVTDTSPKGKQLSKNAYAFYLWYADYSDQPEIKIKWIEYRGPITNQEMASSDALSKVIQQLEQDMVRITEGTFIMGNDTTPPNESGDDESPAYKVEVAAFSLGRYEVTQAQWAAVMGTNPSFFKHCPNCPVEQVSWQEVQLYLRKLNTLTGKSYRLPTEVEWEYAAGGGEKARRYTYAGSNQLAAVAWYGANSGVLTHPVGRKQANELGLYDMSGNVWEYCQDAYAPYPTAPVHLPQDPNARFMCVIRGGTWLDGPVEARIRNRDYCGSDTGLINLGFRLAHP